MSSIKPKHFKPLPNRTQIMNIKKNQINYFVLQTRNEGQKGESLWVLFFALVLH